MQCVHRRLSEASPQAVVTLRTQYRMAADIMDISNALVYNGGMRCGSDAVARGCMRLSLPDPLLRGLPPPDPLLPAHSDGGHSRDTDGVGVGAGPTESGGREGEAAGASGPCQPWLLRALDPAHRVVFLDTSGIPGTSELLVSDGICNPGEAALVGRVVAGLLAAGAHPLDIGLTSPYKAQVAQLQKQAAAAGGGGGGDDGAGTSPSAGASSSSSSSAPIEALTIDKYQGRDKPCVILSFVRSNGQGQVGRLLADWQRINVAVTRAKHKLVMIGCADTLRGTPLLGALLDMVEARAWRVALPSDVLGRQSCDAGDGC
jgi:DNA replication ATP-dependent helicase Dna2